MTATRLVAVSTAVAWLFVILVGLAAFVLVFLPIASATDSPPVTFYMYNGNSSSGVYVGSSGVESGVVASSASYNPAIDYEGCMHDMAMADRNQDGYLKQDQFTLFVQYYALRVCHYEQKELTLEQTSVFNMLACRCISMEGEEEDCCVGQKARMNIQGADSPDRTHTQQLYLEDVCRLVDGTIPEPRGCTDDEYNPDDDKPPFTFVPVAPTEPPVDGGGGGDDGNNSQRFTGAQLVAIIVCAILLLLFVFLLCCAFLRKRSREKELEVEDDEKEFVDTEQAPPLSETDGDEADNMITYAANVASDTPVANPPIGVAAGALLLSTGPLSVLQEVSNHESASEPRSSSSQVWVTSVMHDYQSDREGSSSESERWCYPGQAIALPTEKDDMSEGEYLSYIPGGGIDLSERPSEELTERSRGLVQSEEGKLPVPGSRNLQQDSGAAAAGAFGTSLNQHDLVSRPNNIHRPTSSTNSYDWVLQSALGVVNKSEDAEQYVYHSEESSDDDVIAPTEIHRAGDAAYSDGKPILLTSPAVAVADPMPTLHLDNRKGAGPVLTSLPDRTPQPKPHLDSRDGVGPVLMSLPDPSTIKECNEDEKSRILMTSPSPVNLSVQSAESTTSASDMIQYSFR